MSFKILVCLQLQNLIMKRAKYRGIPCFFSLETGDIKGQNKFYDLLLDCMIWLDIHIFEVDGFPVLVEEENYEK